MAQSHAAALRNRLDEMRSNIDPVLADALDQFIAWFNAKARISMNLSPAILAQFCRMGVYMNIHSWAAEQEKLSGRSAEECLREKLGAYYERRMEFDSAFENGRAFVYAAVNTGGLGASKFGIFCAVLATDYPPSDASIAYIASDSLQCCIDEQGKMSLERLSEILAPHGRQDCLAALKLGNKAVVAPPGSWHGLVLSDSDYIEVVLPTAPEFNRITDVRVGRDRYNVLWDLAFANFRRKLPDAEKALVLDFTYLVAEAKKGRFCLEVLS